MGRYDGGDDAALGGPDGDVFLGAEPAARRWRANFLFRSRISRIVGCFRWRGDRCAMGVAIGWMGLAMIVSRSPVFSAALLLIAGVFQFSPLKHTCLRACRSPLGFLMSDWRDGLLGAWRMGMRHGLYCIGCCWGLMVLLFVGGAMNLLLDCRPRLSRRDRETCAQGGHGRPVAGRGHDWRGYYNLDPAFTAMTAEADFVRFISAVCWMITSLSGVQFGFTVKRWE